MSIYVQPVPREQASTMGVRTSTDVLFRPMWSHQCLVGALNLNALGFRTGRKNYPTPIHPVQATYIVKATMVVLGLYIDMHFTWSRFTKDHRQSYLLQWGPGLLVSCQYHPALHYRSYPIVSKFPSYHHYEWEYRDALTTD